MKQSKKEDDQEKVKSGFAHDVPEHSSALIHSYKVQEKAERIFNFYPLDDALNKVREELGELETAIEDESNIQEELGDLFFTVVNLACKLNIDPEKALRESTEKFINRMRGVEESIEKLGGAVVFENMSQLDFESLWIGVKNREAKIKRKNAQWADGSS